MHAASIARRATSSMQSSRSAGGGRSLGGAAHARRIARASNGASPSLRPHRRCAARALIVRASAGGEGPDARKLAGVKVFPAAGGGEPVDLMSMVRGVPGERTVVAFLTHCGDLTSRWVC